MEGIHVALADVVDGRRLRRAHLRAAHAFVELLAPHPSRRRPGDCRPVCAVIDCLFDYFCGMVSGPRQNISACLPVSAVFALGRTAVRSANRDELDRADNRGRNLGRTPRRWAMHTTKPERDITTL